jgi:hypothetical protein
VAKHVDNTKLPHERVLIWLDEHRGQYIPRDFATSFNGDFRKAHIKGVTDKDWAILENGPGGGLDMNHNKAMGLHYWDTWDEVCVNAKIYLDRPTHPESKNFWVINHDGGCWLIRDDVDWCDEFKNSKLILP